MVAELDASDSTASGTWLEPWTPVDDNDGALARELESEVPPGHPLYGAKVQAVATRLDCDDVVFRLTSSEKLAVVHLTYARESSPEWPQTELFAGFDDFRARRMELDHRDYWDREEESPDWYSRAVRPRP